jgi:hypothetical protein
MGVDQLAAFESAVVAQAPPGAVVVGASISPDGAYGAAWTFLPTAGYLMDDLFMRNGDRWDMQGGGSGGGISWSALGEDDRGVLRYGHDAPDGVSTACLKYKGEEYRVPVRHGHFLFVAWDTGFREHPSLIGYE